MTGVMTVRVEDLVVDYLTISGPLRALDCPWLEIEGGSSAAIIGPSGGGKSTLLCMIAGLATPNAGRVVIGDTIITALSEPDRVAFRKQQMGVVYQADNLLPHLTVVENICLQLALCGDMERGEPRVAKLLDQLGIGALGARLPDQLSGGQRQRVAIARAIIHQPSVILADEPTGALDETNAAAAISLLLEAHQQLGATLIIVTHDPAVAHRMGRLIKLRDGAVMDEDELENAG